MSNETRRKAIILWRQWVRGLPLDPVLKELGITHNRAVKLISSYIRERSEELGKIGASAQVEKIIGAYEEMEAVLWQYIQVYMARWSDATKNNDDRAALRYSETVREFMELLSTVTTRKAEVMRRLGVLPSAVERSAHLIGVVNAPETLSELVPTPRLPTKAPTALPEPTQPDATTVVDVDKTVEVDLPEP
jgi:hypothetical protein